MEIYFGSKQLSEPNKDLRHKLAHTTQNIDLSAHQCGRASVYDLKHDRHDAICLFACKELMDTISSCMHHVVTACLPCLV
jgi:hypothetical protein